MNFKIIDMKKLLIILMCLGFITAINAQVKFGLRAGLNSHYVSGDDFTFEDITISNVKGSNVGFHAGVMMQVSFLGVFIQPELLLSSVGNEVKIVDLDETRFADQKFTKLDIPVMVGKRFGPARIGVGPVATIMLNSTSELNDFDNYSAKFKTATFGFQAGLGLDIAKKIALDLKYEGSLSKLGSGITVGGEERPFDSRARQLIFSVGFLF
jgi:hypothetical protein